ncbi:DUF7210 family protein [Hymenobacter psychrophilus]|uniref:DUF7210 domain-containing protein n=1 Tax=Hymenobacter psychrophilus TaxID=651662 RepID=A0A1H3P979_9BACT|nr:hypothetical protein [Hymenobacter psychrophilus]SDY97666.1 hypothetical protein SAMN04488069_12511 [Hymenobacter psychrophilus]
MKVKALQDFNLGSLAKDYKAGQTVEVSDSVAKELIDAGLAEAPKAEKEDKADASTKEDKSAEARATKATK